jgi:hypothetical protein
MKERQVKKPEFLKDLNTGILDELTRGGRVKNIVGLAGELTELDEVSNICGLPFEGYLGKIKTPRPSKAVDEVVIAIEKENILHGTAAGDVPISEHTITDSIGSRLLISGKMQTLKNFKSGRVLVFVLADFVAVSPIAMLQNDIALVGELAYTPRYRETPKGKHIADIMVKVQNVLTAGVCFVPCVCWQAKADEAAGWQQGDKVKLLGRCQSREYQKEISAIFADGKKAGRETETRTAYEVSIQEIERRGEAENAG